MISAKPMFFPFIVKVLSSIFKSSDTSVACFYFLLCLLLDSLAMVKLITRFTNIYGIIKH